MAWLQLRVFTRTPEFAEELLSAHEASAVSFKGFGEGGDRRKEPLLQARIDEACLRASLRGKLADPKFPQLTVVGQHSRQHQLGRVRRQILQLNGIDDPFGEGLGIEKPQVGLQTADHDRTQFGRANRHAPREALRVEHFQQGREAVGMPVVGRGGEK